MKIYDEENFNIFDEGYEKLDDITLKKVSYAIPFSFNLTTEVIAFVPKQNLVIEILLTYLKYYLKIIYLKLVM